MRTLLKPQSPLTIDLCKLMIVKSILVFFATRFLEYKSCEMKNIFTECVIKIKHFLDYANILERWFIKNIFEVCLFLCYGLMTSVLTLRKRKQIYAREKINLHMILLKLPYPLHTLQREKSTQNKDGMNRYQCMECLLYMEETSHCDVLTSDGVTNTDFRKVWILKGPA